MTTLDQTEILFNKYKNTPDAYPPSSFIANQALGSAAIQIIPDKQCFIQAIPSIAPTDLGSVIVVNSSQSYQQSAAYPWIRIYTITMGAIQLPGISYWYTLTDLNSPETTNVCRDTIPFNFDPLGSYNISVFANSVSISPTITAFPWNYDGDAGILTFYPASFSVLPPTPITMTYWRYVGTKGVGDGILTITNGTHMTGSGTFSANQTGNTNITIATDATDANTASTIVSRSVNKNIGINAVLYWDSINVTHYFSLSTLANILQLNYFNGTTTTTPFSFNGNGVATIPYIKDTAALNGTVGQYLTQGASGILWATLPTIGNGTFTIISGTHLTDSGSFTANQTTASSITISVDATDANTAGTIVARDASGNFTAGTITATTFVGSLTGSATLIDTTPSIAALAYFPTFVPSPVLQINGQVVSTSTALSYVPLTGTLTATTFVGSLTGSATLIDTEPSTAALAYFPTFVPSPALQINGQVVSTSTALSYVPLTGTLTATTFDGGANYINTNIMTGSTFYPICVNTPGTVANQIPWTNSTFNFTQSTNTLNVTNCDVLSQLEIGTGYTSSAIIGILGRLNAGATKFLQINDSTNTTTLLSFNNAGLTTTLPITSRLTAINTATSFNIVFANANAATVSSLLYIDTNVPLTYNPSTGVITSTSYVGAITTVASSTAFDYTFPFVSGSGTQTLLVDTSIYKPLYNPNTVLFTIYDLKINYALRITDIITPANEWFITSGLNSLSFNNSFSPRPVPLIIDGDTPRVEVYQLSALTYDDGLAIELDSALIYDGYTSQGGIYNGMTNTDYASFVSITQPTSTVSGALLTMSVKPCNPNGKILTVSFPFNTVFNAVSQTLSQSQTVNLTAYTITMTKNAVNFTNFAYDPLTATVSKAYIWGAVGYLQNPIQQPFAQLTVYFKPDDTIYGTANDIYVIKVVATMTKSGGGTIAFLNGVSGFALDFGTARSPNPSPGFGFSTTDTSVTALSVLKNQTNLSFNGVISDAYLQAQYINFVYQRTFTSAISELEPLCFPTGVYNTFNISWNFTSAPTAYTALTMGLATNNGTYLLANYSGLIAVLGSTYNTTAWGATTGALINYLSFTANEVCTAQISFPNNTRIKTITATNKGSSSVLLNYIPMVSAGSISTTTAYNSMWWSVVGTAVNGTITITGTNL